MNKIIPHIEFLLQSHDCVILPGIGAVLAHSVAPSYDDDAQEWCAPSRVISFNPALSRTDGLLAASIARRDGISLDSAAAVVRTEVDALRREMDTDGAISLGAVGCLTRDDQGHMSFVPGEAEWLSPEYMWLPNVAMPVIGGSDSLGDDAEESAARGRLSIAVRRASQIAVGIAAIIALGWIAVQNMGNAPMEQLASLWPATSEAIAQQPVDTHTDTDTSAPAVILAAEPSEVVTENISPSEVVVTEPTPVAQPEYFLIVASLATRADAEKFKLERNDNSLGILEKDGRYRVYAASGNTYAEVAEMGRQDAMAKKYSDTWVCHK